MIWGWVKEFSVNNPFCLLISITSWNCPYLIQLWTCKLTNYFVGMTHFCKYPPKTGSYHSLIYSLWSSEGFALVCVCIWRVYSEWNMLDKHCERGVKPADCRENSRGSSSSAEVLTISHTRRHVTDLNPLGVCHLPLSFVDRCDRFFLVSDDVTSQCVNARAASKLPLASKL